MFMFYRLNLQLDTFFGSINAETSKKYDIPHVNITLFGDCYIIQIVITRNLMLLLFLQKQVSFT